MPIRRLARLALIGVIAVAVGAPLAASGGEGFVAGTEDVPLMAGLKPVDGSSLVFDKPQGRIVEAQAKGRVSRDKVRAFYTGTLPQLGWAASGDGVWLREGETLRIDLAGRDGDLTVGFTLSPQDGAPQEGAPPAGPARGRGTLTAIAPTREKMP
jgi:hypothetical protein